MDENRVAAVVRRLRAWEMNGLAASLLEAGGPLGVLGAQAIYFAQPFLTPFVVEDEVTAFAQWLENPAALRALAHRLTEEAS